MINIKLSKVFVGDLKKVVDSMMVSYMTMKCLGTVSSLGHMETETVLVQKNVCLYELRDVHYVNLNKARFPYKKKKIKKLLNLTKNDPIPIDGKLVIAPTSGLIKQGDFIVDESTIKPAYLNVDKDNTKQLSKVRKELKCRNISK